MQIPGKTVTTVDTKIVVRSNASMRPDPVKEGFRPPSFLSAPEGKKILSKVTMTADQEKSIIRSPDIFQIKRNAKPSLYNQ